MIIAGATDNAAAIFGLLGNPPGILWFLSSQGWTATGCAAIQVSAAARREAASATSSCTRPSSNAWRGLNNRPSRM